MAAPVRTEEEITTGLLALITWSGNASAAARALKAEGKLTVGPDTLRAWATERHSLRYAELRDKYQEQIEQGLIHEMREMVGRALQVQRLALDKAEERLDAGKDDDPARTAANVARVAQSNTDKMLSLSGRPTQIREDRNVEEILRSLAAKGVVRLPDAEVEPEPVPQIEGGGGDGT